jgi:hypothetical protein
VVDTTCKQWIETYLEEKPNNEHLQGPHGDNQCNLDETEIQDSFLRTPNRAEIPVLSRSEVFLTARDG